MTRAQNEAMLKEIGSDLGGSSAMWIVDYRGLTVKESQDLRHSVREAGAACKVFKNRIMMLALKDAGWPQIDDLLEGPNAFIFAAGDVAQSAKAINDFARNNENLEIKGGIMDGAVVSADEVKTIASLPSREELIARIAGAISGVARSLATALDAVPSGIARAVGAVAEQKEQKAA